MNASCTVHGPLAPALLFGLSVLAGATTGAVVTGTAGSTPRAVGGFVVALLMTALVAALTTLIAVALGLPALFYSVSHC
jgi:ABC-type iron transport system FetAB permease component